MLFTISPKQCQKATRTRAILEDWVGTQNEFQSCAYRILNEQSLRVRQNGLDGVGQSAEARD